MIATVEIRRAEIDEKSAIWNLLKFHLSELSAFGSVNNAYPYFDSYWTEGTRWPYLIEIVRQKVGFALVNQHSPSGRGTDFAIAEFYVLPQYRGRRYGTEAAHQIFKMHPGQWELSIFLNNAPA